MPTLNTLVNFSSGGGIGIGGNLIADAAGNLFGTRAGGGANIFGNVFEIANTSTGYASTATTLASFSSTTGGTPANAGLIADSAGNLFGTTSYDGSFGTVFEIANTGTGYATTPITLASFNGTDGAAPFGNLIADAAGNLFGTTELGGANGDGAVFEIANTSTGYATTPIALVSFNLTDGYAAESGLIADAAGDLFGTTAEGGAYENSVYPYGYGTVFEITKTLGGYASTPTVLVSFNGNGGYPNDEWDPRSGLIADAAGDLFGAASLGGADSDGAVYEIANTSTGYASTPTVLAAFDGTGGGGPDFALIADAAGDLFGTTTYGGTNGDGTVFEIVNTSTGYASTPVTLVNFSGANGENPAGSLIANAAGDLLGTTGNGGAHGDGTAFEVTNAGFLVATTITLPAGMNNTLIVTDAILSSEVLTIRDGANSNNTVSAAGDTAANIGKVLTYDTGTGTDSFTGGFENDTVDVSAAALAGDTLTGGSGINTLVLTSAGTLNLGGVSNFTTIDLAAGNNTVTVTDVLLSHGSLTINDGASGNNTISATSDTSASKGKAITYNAGTGTDSFTGGFENDTVNVSAAAVGGDTLTGGSGSNSVMLINSGSVDLGGVSKFPLINLGAGNYTVTVTDTTLSDGAVTIRAGREGASGDDSVSAAGDTAASKGKTLIYSTETGKASFAGGFETDMVRVSAATVGGDTLTGGSGNNTLMLTTAGSVDLDAVSLFCAIGLAAGNNTVTVTDTTLAGGAITMHAGASGNDSVSAAGDTHASQGKTFFYYTGTGTDSFTGGFENDVVHVSAAALGGDTLKGSSGNNTLMLTSAGSIDLDTVSNFGAIDLAFGDNTVTVTDTTLSGGAVTMHAGSAGINVVSAADDTAASKGKTFFYYTGPQADSFTGGFENDVVHVSAATVGNDPLKGGSGNNTLMLTSAGSIDLATVSKFSAIDLAAGNNTVTVTNTTLTGGAITMHAGASGNDSVSAAGDTGVSQGKTFFYYTGTGTDSFTGGSENDVVHVSAAALGGDTLTGGSGFNTLMLTSAGSVNLGTVSNFAAIDLAAGNNTVTVTDTTLSGNGPVVVIQAGASGNNNVSAAGDTDGSEGSYLIYHAGTGTDSFTGGSENDIIFAGTGLGTYSGLSYTHFVFMADNLPTQTLNNFRTDIDAVVVYGIHASNGFDLGRDNSFDPGGGTAIDSSLFIANASGDFTSSSQRFAYDTTNGQLHYSATGNNASESLVATLTGAPAMTASDLLFAY